MRNLDRVRGFLKTLQDEISDPEKFGHPGDRHEWQRPAAKLDENLIDLRDLITSKNRGIDS